MYSTLYLVLSLTKPLTMTWKGTIRSLLFTMSCSGITPRLNQLPRHRNTLIWFFSSQLGSSITAVCEKKLTHYQSSLFNAKVEIPHILQMKVFFYVIEFYFLYTNIHLYTHTCTLLSMFITVCQHCNCHLISWNKLWGMMLSPAAVTSWVKLSGILSLFLPFCWPQVSVICYSPKNMRFR